MKTVLTKDIAKEKLIEFFNTHWGSPKMVISSGVYNCSTLAGFATLNEKEEIIGLITFVVREEECEIISLDSLKEGCGIGSSLVQKVEEAAQKNHCKRVTLVTTNDNLKALKFYQKRGFVLKQIHHQAVEKARRIKPEIPLIGYDGIPIRDEIELEKPL